MHIPLQQKRLWPRSKPELRFIFTFEASKVRALGALIEVTVLFRAVGTGRGAGGARLPQIFGRSVNPISTRGQIMPTNYYSLPKIFRPSDIPAVLFDATAKTGENRQISTTNHQFYT